MSNSTMWIRRFSIRLRMQCAIVMVLGLFSLVGLTGVVGGRHLAELNSEFMLHSIKEVHNVGAIRAALGEVRHRLALRLKAQPALALALGGHPVVGGNAAFDQHGGGPSRKV